jgi:DNA adenine methylase
MPTTDSPLRYPGGKTQLAPLVIDLLRENDLFYCEYAEPFAGGSGLALQLLLDGYVTKLYLNDIDPSVYAFWSCVLRKTDALCERIQSVCITMDEWHRQREIYRGSRSNILDLGFATLFLNRTNRSGIIGGGVIGGKDQAGNYKLDCRFNRVDLANKVRRIAAASDRISLSKLDALEFVTSVLPKMDKRGLVNLDPPYFGKGPELYTNFYNEEDHRALARAISKIKQRWIVTYDDEPVIRSLYGKFRVYASELNYFAQVKRIGTELLVLDPKLRPPAVLRGAEISSPVPL